MLDREEKALRSAFEMTAIRKCYSVLVCVWTYSFMDKKRVSFIQFIEILMIAQGYMILFLFLVGHVSTHAHSYKYIQSHKQTKCLSIHGSWQNRFSQAWKSTWIPIRLAFDALMRHCLRPMSTFPRYSFTQWNGEPCHPRYRHNLRVSENRMDPRWSKVAGMSKNLIIMISLPDVHEIFDFYFKTSFFSPTT